MYWRKPGNQITTMSEYCRPAFLRSQTQMNSTMYERKQQRILTIRSTWDHIWTQYVICHFTGAIRPIVHGSGARLSRRLIRRRHHFWDKQHLRYSKEAPHQESDNCARCQHSNKDLSTSANFWMMMILRGLWSSKHNWKESAQRRKARLTKSQYNRRWPRCFPTNKWSSSREKITSALASLALKNSAMTQRKARRKTVYEKLRAQAQQTRSRVKTSSKKTSSLTKANPSVSARDLIAQKRRCHQKRGANISYLTELDRMLTL